MGRFRAFNGRHGLEMAVVLVPLLAILVLQYVSSRRLAEVEVIAHQTTVARYLDAVAADVRSVYESAAHEMLDVSGDVLAAKRFDEVARHFDRTDTSAARLLFAAALDGCLCLTRYYDPRTGTISIGADADADAVAVVLRASTLLRAGTLLSRRVRLHLNRSDLYVDEVDPGNRAVYRFVTDTAPTGAEARIVGIVGFLIDEDRFEREYLPRAIAGALDVLEDGLRDNLVVRTTDGAGRVATTTHADPGQADILATRFDFVFRDWNVSARSRHAAAAQVLQANAFTSSALTVLMSVAVLCGVLLTWRAAGRERRMARIRNAFVANVSHELRTPLASLIAFGELLRRGIATSPGRVVEYGRRIEHECNRLKYIIENVLDFARIESATVHYRKEEAAIEDIVAAAIRAVDTRREQGCFTISVSYPGTLLPSVCVDTQAITQVFVNLLDNAMKYSGPSRHVRVGLGQRGGHVAVSIADSGIGIAPDDHERIFHEFCRANGSGQDSVSGTGLGLAIVRHAVRAHRGEVEVESQVGQGATFTVLMPITTALTASDGGGEARVGHSNLEVPAG